MPKLRIEESAARKQARIDRVSEVVVGVNKYQDPPAEPGALGDGLELLSVDNEAVLKAQLERLASIKAGRDEGKAQAALRFLTESAWRTEEYEGHGAPHFTQCCNVLVARSQTPPRLSIHWPTALLCWCSGDHQLLQLCRTGPARMRTCCR